MQYKIKKYPIKSVPKVQLAFWIVTRISLIGCMIYSFVFEHDLIMGFESCLCFVFCNFLVIFYVLGNGSFFEEVRRS